MINRAGDSDIADDVFLLGLISPAAVLAWGYAGGFWRAGSDVHDLLRMFPSPAVQAFFLVALVTCISGIRQVRRGAGAP